MKIYIIYINLLFYTVLLNAQTKDLNYFIGKAKTNSPLIHKNRTDNRIWDAEVQRLKAFYTQPEIRLNAGLLFSPVISKDNNATAFQWITQDATDYYGYDLAVSDGGQYQAVILVEQPLFAGKKLETVYWNAGINKQKNETNIQLTEHDLERIVGYQYLRCLQAKKQIIYFAGLQELINNELAQMKQLVKNGIYKPSDLQRLKIELEHYKIKITEAEAGYKQSFYDLNILCGNNDTVVYDLQEVSFQLKPAIPDSSFFLKRYRLDSLNLWTLQQISELKYQPQVSLFADGGLNAVYLPGINRLGVSMGIKFSWILFDGHQRDFERTKTNLMMEDIGFKKQYFATKQSQELLKIKEKIKETDRQLQMKKKQQTEYQKLLVIYKTELSQGNISVIDFTNTIRDMANLKQEIILLEMEKQALINSYNYWNF